MQATVEDSCTSEMPDVSTSDLVALNEGGKSRLAAGGDAGTGT